MKTRLKAKAMTNDGGGLRLQGPGKGEAGTRRGDLTRETVVRLL
jgi:hypothetical protein